MKHRFSISIILNGIYQWILDRVEAIFIFCQWKRGCFFESKLVTTNLF